MSRMDYRRCRVGRRLRPLDIPLEKACRRCGQAVVLKRYGGSWFPYEQDCKTRHRCPRQSKGGRVLNPSRRDKTQPEARRPLAEEIDHPLPSRLVEERMGGRKANPNPAPRVEFPETSPSPTSRKLSRSRLRPRGPAGRVITVPLSDATKRLFQGQPTRKQVRAESRVPGRKLLVVEAPEPDDIAKVVHPMIGRQEPPRLDKAASEPTQMARAVLADEHAYPAIHRPTPGASLDRSFQPSGEGSANRTDSGGRDPDCFLTNITPSSHAHSKRRRRRSRRRSR